MDVHLSTWLITGAVLIAGLGLDVFVIGRNVHEPSMKEAGASVTVFVALAVVFGLGVWATAGSRYAGEFFAGWLTEYSLSVDNLFIFLIIMAKLAVPRSLQQYALTVGIILALIFRGIFIAVGAAAINRFSWVFFIFGAFLVYTAARLVADYRSHGEEEEEVSENALMRFVNRRFPSTDDFHGRALTVARDGRRFITPMMFVIIALGSTDLLFALDSIPAIYGLTQEPYLVFSANVFALMGLRQLYFLIGGLLRKLVYLSLGLSFILAFIGLKLILHALHKYHGADWAPYDGEIPIWLSLTVIIGTLVITTAASLVASGRSASDQATSGQAASDQAVSDHAVSDQAATGQTSPDHAAPDQTASDRITPGQAIPHQATPDRTASEQATSGRAAPDQTTSDRAAPDQVSPGQATSDPAPSQTTASQATPDRADDRSPR